ncbi:MAG: preprotein translocase subunit SecE [Pirellulales bacterium]|nr:preprotein translocase subunit SecE [Pirellulales bacterium]
MVVCTPASDSLPADGVIRVKAAGAAAATDVAVRKGDDPTNVVAAVNKRQEATGVVANLRKVKDGGEELVIAGKGTGSKETLEVELPPGAFYVGGKEAAGVIQAQGSDSVNIGLQYLVPGVLFFASLWSIYRLVNVPAFADFLIAVEAEMNKVSWPASSELFRSSIVVLIFIFALAIILAVYDFGWSVLFRKVLHVLPEAAPQASFSWSTLLKDLLHII